MSFTKLRLSWGRIGNNNVGSHSYLSNIGNGRSDWWIGSTNPLSFGTPTVAATTLTWEPVETIDLGINTKFFDNSLDIEFEKQFFIVNFKMIFSFHHNLHCGIRLMLLG